MPAPPTRLTACLLLSSLFVLSAKAAEKVFHAGAFAADITPTNFPVIVNGGFREKTSDTVHDRLHARCLVLDDGTERIAFVVADSCMVPRDLLDRAKSMAFETTGIRPEKMLISSTHTHSGPSAMGALGSSADPHYIKVLPAMIAEGIRQANSRRQPARVGWAVIDAPEHTKSRRWILRPDKLRGDPFGDVTVRATMHPGHENPSFIGPSGPVDTGLSLLAVQSVDGEPLAMFANFSMHYYGSPAISADYFGAFTEEFASLIEAGDGRNGFVAAMSQGTSGDLQWMDYAQPRANRDTRRYAAEVAAIAHQAWQGIRYQDQISLAMAETRLTLKRRVAGAQRLQWARRIAATLKNRKPATQQEIYAREQVMIAENPVRELILQAARVGGFGITAIPNEVYAITGLKLKAFSPLQPTFNVELANGSEGYIPPPEQHHLGGYTTWEARSAALETNAEPKIVEALLGLLEKVAGRPRRPFSEVHGVYARQLLTEKPIAYWRMGEFAGTTLTDSSGNGHGARLEPGFALHLEGPPGKGFCEAATVNRAVQFAGGKMVSDLPDIPDEHRVEFWFWNGLPASAREVTGVLYSRGPESLALVRDGNESVLELSFAEAGGKPVRGVTKLKPKSWHHVSIAHASDRAWVSLDGKPELNVNYGRTRGALRHGKPVRFGGDENNTANFEGRIDEIAVFAIEPGAAETPAYIAGRPALSGITEWRVEKRRREREKNRLRADQIAGPPGKADYRREVGRLKPAVYWSFDQAADGKVTDSGGRRIPGTIDGSVDTVARLGGPLTAGSSVNLGARFSGGRVKADIQPLPLDYSVGFWFRNEQPNNSRAVTAYLFSRGPEGDRTCPGDHLGIGGTHERSLTGKLIVFNGNRLDQVVAGPTTIERGRWHHVLMIRQGDRMTVHLDGRRRPEITAVIPPSINAGETRIFFGGRNDNFANLNGRLDEAAVWDRVLSAAEVQALQQAAIAR